MLALLIWTVAMGSVESRAGLTAQVVQPTLPVRTVTEQRASIAQRLWSWLGELEHDSRAAGEISRFEHHESSPSPEYATALMRAVRGLVVEAATRRVTELQEGTCTPFVDADFLRAGFATAGPENAEDRFEGGFIRTEMVACFVTSISEPDSVLDLYTSADFREEVESRIDSIWAEDGLSCVATGGMWALLDPTLACNRIDRMSVDGLAAEHSQVVWNQGVEPYQDLFFKESLKTFVRIPEGIAYHYINYSRSVRLGRLKRAIGGGRIKGSQEDNARALAARIGG